MSFARFIGQTGALVFLEMLVLAFVVTPILSLCLQMIQRFGGGENQFRATWWTNFGSMCFLYWLLGTMIVLAARHYAGGSVALFGILITVGSLFFLLVKVECVFRRESESDRQLQQASSNPFHLMLLQATGHVPTPDMIQRYWVREYAAVGVAFLYVLAAAIFPPLTQVQWVVTISGWITSLMTNHGFISVLLCVFGCLAMLKSLFAVCFCVLALGSLAASRVKAAISN